VANSDVASRIEAPALGFDLTQSRNLAKSRYIDVLSLWEVLLHQLLTSVYGCKVFVAVEPCNIGNELDLLRREVLMCPVNLPENVASIDEENFVFSVCL